MSALLEDATHVGRSSRNYLSIDGGLSVPSGLFALYLLNEMFERLKWDLKSDTMPLPCELFEIIIGTGTGAIIALFLGRLRLSIPQAIEAYEKLMPALSIGPAQSDEERMLNSERLETAFRQVLVDYGFSADDRMLDDTAPKTFICTLRTSNVPFLHPVRSYRIRGAPSQSSTILQAACASVSSLDKFLPVTLGVLHSRIDLVDATLGHANPTQELLREVQRLHGESSKVANIVSIGTGRPRPISVRDQVDERVPSESLRQMVASCEQVHRELYSRLQYSGVYHRFNLNQETEGENVSLLSDTLAYLEDGEVSARIDEATKGICLRLAVLNIKDINTTLTVKSTLKPRPALVQNFIGRQDILEAMRNTHFNNRASSLYTPATTVLFGQGGSGKTQTALKFALELESRYPDILVYFLDASADRKLQADFESIIRSQSAASRHKSYIDAIEWLTTALKKWCLIFDNADDPSVDIFKYIPKVSHGNVIITTRNATYHTLAPDSSHLVEGLSAGDATTLILHASSNRDTQDNRGFAAKIAEKLGYLPLALAQAAGYIMVHLCLSSYLDTYSQNQARLLKSSLVLPHEYRTSVATTIQMSLDHLPRQVYDMLLLFSYMQANSIAHCIIVSAAQRRFCRIDDWPEEVTIRQQSLEHSRVLMDIFCPSGEWLESDFNDLILQCLRYSLLQVSTRDDAKFYSMHVLVQSYLRSSRRTVQDYRVGQLVVRMLGSAITVDNEYEYVEFNKLLVPHVQLIEMADIAESGDHYCFGRVLMEQGCMSLAAKYLETSIASYESHVGRDHCATVETMGDLAVVYDHIGKHQEALELEEAVLQFRRDTLGDEDPHTLLAMGNLARGYAALGRHADALAFEERALETEKKLVGDEHPDTLRMMANLASTYQELGRSAEALKLEAHVLAVRKQHYGIEHRDTLLAMWNLSITLQLLGKEKQRNKLLRTALPLYEKVYGVDHPETLQIRTSLNECS